MKIYDGQIGMVGGGTWHSNSLGHSVCRRSIVEIGTHTLKNLCISEQLENFVKPGNQAKFGVIDNHLVALETNGKKYKHGYWSVLANRALTTAYLIPIGMVVLLILLFNNIKNADTIMWLVALAILSRFVYKTIADNLAMKRF